MAHSHYRRLFRLALLWAVCAGQPALASRADHREFSAMLYAPYTAEAAGDGVRSEARSFVLAFEYPLVDTPQAIVWQLELRDRAGQLVRQWEGVESLVRDPLSVGVRWDGQAGSQSAAPGIYHVRLRAAAHEAAAVMAGEAEVIEQEWDIAVGPATPATMPAFTPMPSAQTGPMAAPATGSLPYTVYLGNLHSQTGHSDGGGELASCSGAQAPQSSRYGPSDAYTYAMGRGLDILVASEHNHMYDGSDGSNPDADPAAARALYRSGLTAASDFNATHPGFLAVYGLEWGVINNGGHMNIFNSPELLGWERSSDGQLFGDRLTAKGDYAGLYTLMRRSGWVGQFNHPSESGQFQVGAVALGYTEDGDQAMALCEVVNSTAFSANSTETETRRSNFELACNKLLEAGYHVAFSSNQDNHCANWGASYTNRTGVLIPTGTALTSTSFIDALKARRVFATMDKGSQLVLTANGHMMGERFVNSGPLALAAHFASNAGKAVSSVVMLEGVPGRNGTVSELAASATSTVTPTPGEHFYYAKLTQVDGNILWSAPVWVTQSAPVSP